MSGKMNMRGEKDRRDMNRDHKQRNQPQGP